MEPDTLIKLHHDWCFIPFGNYLPLAGQPNRHLAKFWIEVFNKKSQTQTHNCSIFSWLKKRQRWNWGMLAEVAGFAWLNPIRVYVHVWNLKLFFEWSGCRVFPNFGNLVLVSFCWILDSPPVWRKVYGDNGTFLVYFSSFFLLSVL